MICKRCASVMVFKCCECGCDDHWYICSNKDCNHTEEQTDEDNT